MRLDRPRAFGCLLALLGCLAAPVWAGPTYRVLVDTDLGGDPDDIQSLVRAVHYSDILKIEGWVSTPRYPDRENSAAIREWIRRVDVGHLRGTMGYTELMTESDLLARVVAGNADRGNPGSIAHTPGAQLIRDRANAGSASNPLYVFVWGRWTTLAKALSEEPGIADKIRIISLGGNNAANDQAAADFLYDFRNTHANMWWLDIGGQRSAPCMTMLGMYSGPIAKGTGEYGREGFLKTHIRGHGTRHDGDFAQSIGDAFPFAGYPAQIAVGRGWLKEGDSPTMLYLIGASLAGAGNVNDPRENGWGGRYQRPLASSPNYYTDLTGSDETCQSTIWEDRVTLLKNWRARWDRYEGVNAGLRGHWKLDSGGGDASGSDNDGALQGATAWGPGKMNRALWFDGASTYASVANNGSLDLTDAFTIAAWIKLERGDGVRYMLAKTTAGSEEPSAAGAYVVYKDASDRLCYRASGSGGPGLCSATAIANQAWQHWAIVKDGNTLRFWRDGRLDRTVQNLAANQTPRINSNRLSIGRRGDAGNFWKGRIDDLRIYDRALSEEEVLVLGP